MRFSFMVTKNRPYAIPFISFLQHFWKIVKKLSQKKIIKEPNSQNACYFGAVSFRESQNLKGIYY